MCCSHCCGHPGKKVSLPWSTLTSASMRQGCTPKKGIMGKAGLGSTPGGAGRGVIIIPPVSADSSTHHIFTPHYISQTMSSHNILTPHFTTHTLPTTSHHTCLPPCVHNGASLVAHHFVVPLPGINVQWLPHCTHTQTDRQTGYHLAFPLPAPHCPSSPLPPPAHHCPEHAVRSGRTSSRAHRHSGTACEWQWGPCTAGSHADVTPSPNNDLQGEIPTQNRDIKALITSPFPSLP